MNLEDNCRVAVYCGLYHGGSMLTECQTSDPEAVTDGECTFDSTIELDIEMADIPPMTRLCLVVYEAVFRSRKGSRGAKFLRKLSKDLMGNPLSWVS